MVAENVLRQIRLIIYRLKRNYGVSMTLYSPEYQTHNVQTGDITRQYEKWTIRKAVLLPKNLERKFVYDLSYIAAAKNFTMGGFFDQDTRTVLIDARDLSVEPTDEMHLEINHKDIPNERLEIQNVVRAENRKAYLLTVKAVSNSNAVQ